MYLRVACLNDEVPVTALLKKAYASQMSSFYEAELLAKAIPVMTKANRLLLESGTYYVVENDEQIIGCGGWTLEQPGMSGHIEKELAHLRHFATDPDFTLAGVGRMIFNQCFLEAKKQNMIGIQAFAGLNAEPFYKRLGLKRVQLIEIAMGEDIKMPAVLMEGLII